MEIFWSGHSFKLKGKLATAIVSAEGVSIEPQFFSGPGEYESKGIMVTGIKGEEGVAYQITVDGLQIVYLGSKVSGEQTDILLTPTAGDAADLEPKIIIPFAEDTESLNKLIKELGGEGVTPQPKLSVTKDKLPEEPTVVVLQHG